MKKLIHIILNKIFYIVYFLLNILTRKKKKQIVFISFPGATDNSWYLYQYIAKNYEGFDLIWLLDGLSDKVLAKQKISCFDNKNNISIVDKWSVKGIILFCTSKFVFHTHGTYSFVRKAPNAPVIINLWHGMPIKAIGHLDEKNKYVCYSDYTISTSKMYKEIMSKAFSIPLNRVLNFGLPRNDVLKNGLPLLDSDKIFKKLKISSSEQILIWLPTYRQSKIGDIRQDSLHSSFLEDLPEDFLQSLDDECSLNRTKIIIKLHPMDSFDIKNTEFQFKNIIFMNSKMFESLNIQLYDLLSISKGLISDVSSVMIDCFTTDISVGLIQRSHASYTRDFVVDLDKLLGNTFLINSSIDVFEMLKSPKKDVSVFNDGFSEACCEISNYFLGESTLNRVQK